MGSINASVDLSRKGGVAIVTIDNPPVNALKHEVRAGLVEAFEQRRGRRRPSAPSCSPAPGAPSSAGADITEFGKPPRSPGAARRRSRAIEAIGKPVVAALHGTAARRRLRAGARLPLPRRGAGHPRRAARSEARPPAGRRRHAAPAAPHRAGAGAAAHRHRRADRRVEEARPRASSTRSSKATWSRAPSPSPKLRRRGPPATPRARSRREARRRAGRSAAPSTTRGRACQARARPARAVAACIESVRNSFDDALRRGHGARARAVHASS